MSLSLLHIDGSTACYDWQTLAASGSKYVVHRKAIVRPWQIWVLRYRGLVLSACHPAGSSAYRYVVFAALTR